MTSRRNKSENRRKFSKGEEGTRKKGGRKEEVRTVVDGSMEHKLEEEGGSLCRAGKEKKRGVGIKGKTYSSEIEGKRQKQQKEYKKEATKERE